jgi:hypothetical protein
MLDHGGPGGGKPRWITYVAVVVAVVLGAMTAVAVAQQGTGSQSETTTQTTPGTPTIPEGFSEEDCTFDQQPDGSTVVRCQSQEESTTRETGTSEQQAEEQAAGEASTTEQVETEVVPVGGTGAGAGGTAADDGSALPVLIGIGGLVMALTAAVLMRRRRLG